MSARSNILQEALIEADKVEELTVDRIREELYNAFTPKLRESVSRAISETVSTGKDQPSGYNQEEDQDALAFGSSKHSTAKKDDINKGGKGPQKLEGSLGMDEMYDDEDLDEREDFDSESDDLDVIPVNDGMDEMYDDEDLDESSEDEELDEASEDEDLDESSEDEELDEASEDEDLDETNKDEVDETVAALQKENKKVKKELIETKKAFGILRKKVEQVNLLNAKMAGAHPFLNDPNLTIKQKQSIVESFDRAKNVREVKLISSTFKQGLRNSRVRKVANTNISSVASRSLNESYSAEIAEQRHLAGLE